VPAHQPGLLKNLLVVGELVGRDPQLGAELRRGVVPYGEQVDDAEPCLVGQRSVHAGAPLEIACFLTVH
jgi:hypothetical protein